MSDFPTSYHDPSFQDPSKSTTIMVVGNSADPDHFLYRGSVLLFTRGYERGTRFLDVPV